MKTGDLVVWDSGRIRNPEEYAIIKEVREHNGLFPAEVLLTFPMDGSEGWYLAENVRPTPNSND